MLKEFITHDGALAIVPFFKKENFMSWATNIGNAIGNAVSNFGNYSAQAAARANGVSAAAQSAQGTFNKDMANIANQIGSDRISEQYNFNSGQAAMANEFTNTMWNQAAAWNEAQWDKTAAWNEAMMEKQMEFNAAEAQKNRDWQQKMRETAYQTAIADMEKAGLNPILAVTGGGISTGSLGGSAASVGGTSMGAPSLSGATGAMASGGLMNGISASESSYTGQMEYMSGMLGLLSAAISGVSSAVSACGNMGNIGIDIGEGLAKLLGKEIADNANNYKAPQVKAGEEAGKALRNFFKQ